MQKLIISAAVVLGFVGLLPAVPGQAQQVAAIEVDQPDTLWDAPVHIQVSGLEPNQVVTVGAQTPDAKGQVWASSAELTATAGGTLDLATAAPSSGSYTGTDPMGLFWSMTPPDFQSGELFTPPDTSEVTLTVAAGGATLAQRDITRRTTVPSMTQTTLTVAEDGLFATMFGPPDTGNLKPAVLVFGRGSTIDGEVHPMVVAMAKLLAAHGYPALALAYYGGEGLPPTLQHIPLEYVGTALDYLKNQPGVDPNRISTLGFSKGGAPSQLMGVLFPESVSGVIALVTSDVVECEGPGSPFTWQGEPVPCDRPVGLVAVDQIQGPLFLGCGGKDPFGNRCAHAQSIIDRRAESQVPYQDVLLAYSDAGHHLGYALPYWPPPAELQGTAEDNAAARADLWPQLLEFIEALPR